VPAIGEFEGEIEARAGLLDRQPGLEFGEVDIGHGGGSGMYRDCLNCTFRVGPVWGVEHMDVGERLELRKSRLDLAQDTHDLDLGESALLHSESPRSGGRENSTHDPR
jgi:hypothetical protein